MLKQVFKYNKFSLFLMVILTCLITLTGCVAPIIFNVSDSRYKSEQPRVTILPIYARSTQIYNLKKISPLLEDVQFDDQYFLYSEYDQELDEQIEKKQNVFYLVVTTRF